jgi:hypothetical protein
MLLLGHPNSALTARCCTQVLSTAKSTAMIAAANITGGALTLMLCKR